MIDNLDLLLSRHEWDFSEVPDDELAAACLWEYSRESPSITEAAFQHMLMSERANLRARRGDMSPEAAREREQLLDALLESDPDQNSAYERFLEAFYGCRLGFDEAYSTVKDNGGIPAQPWQELPADIRKRISAQVGRSHVFVPLRVAMLRELRRLWQINLSDAEQQGSPLKVEDFDDWAGYEQTDPVPDEPADDGTPASEMLVAFYIGFGDFTNKEIVSAFAAWLEVSRPAECPEPSRRGKKLRDQRVALERLGLMRLLHRYSPAELRLKIPPAWKFYERKALEFRKEIRAAAATFHRLFPFCPPEEELRSLRRKGARKRGTK